MQQHPRAGGEERRGGSRHLGRRVEDYKASQIVLEKAESLISTFWKELAVLLIGIAIGLGSQWLANVRSMVSKEDLDAKFANHTKEVDLEVESVKKHDDSQDSRIEVLEKKPKPQVEVIVRKFVHVHDNGPVGR